MNKELFVALCDHIGRSVPEIRFIDFDRGQLSSGERPPVDWPYCFLPRSNLLFTSCTPCEELNPESFEVCMLCNPRNDPHFPGARHARPKLPSFFRWQPFFNRD